MYFSKAERFDRNLKNKLWLSQTQVLTATESLYGQTQSPHIKPPFNKKCSQKPDESFEKFLSLVQENIKMTAKKNRECEQQLQETQKHTNSLLNVIKEKKDKRISVHYGMFVKLLGTPATLELGPGSYEQHNGNMGRQSYNIMNDMKILKRNNSEPRIVNKSKP